MKVTITELKKLLSEGPTTFRFKKLDGTIRKMVATTNPEWIPENKEIVQMSHDAVTVFDMEKSAFRRVSNYVDIAL
tara:strand:+ start:339 stop:566 length:228 start_codon:yes stop_codon:yes gene_type:complete